MTKRFIFYAESKNYVSPYVPIKTLDGYGLQVFPYYSTNLEEYKLTFDFYAIEDQTWEPTDTPVALTIYATIDAGTIPFNVTIPGGEGTVIKYEDYGDVTITSTDPSTINGYAISLSPGGN